MAPEPATASVELGKAWSEYLAALDEMRRILEASPRFQESPADRAKAYHAVMEVQAMAYNFVVSPRMLHPRVFTRQAWIREIYTLAQNCQDFVYSTVFLDGRRRYRMRGRVGDTSLFIVQMFNGSFGDPGLKTTGNFDAIESATDADGWFEVTIGHEPEPGMWLPLNLESDYQMLLVRRALVDWHGDPGDISIERLDEVPLDHYDADEFSEAAMARRIRRATGFLRFIIEDNVIGLYARYLSKAEGERNTLISLPGESLGMGSNSISNYGAGVFDLQADEALILTMDEEPDGAYWSYQLGDVWSRSLDFSDHQSTLNIREAVIDDDGALRVVIARRDPGISNWLDTCGRQHGTIVFRNYRTTSTTVADAVKVPFADLHKHLPPRTKRVTAAERQRALDHRRSGLLKLYGE